MAGHGGKGGVDWGWFVIIVFAVAAMGGGVKGCDTSGTGGGGGNDPAPKTSQVCNEYFKGGC
jgi:hypothetical protein